MCFADLLAGIKLFGASFFVKAVAYRLKGRIGLLERQSPKNHWQKLDLNSFIKPNFKKESIKNELLHTKFFPVRDLIKNSDSLKNINSKSAETIKSADDILEGKFKYFGCRRIEGKLAGSVKSGKSRWLISSACLTLFRQISLPFTQDSQSSGILLFL